jgi:hypothetical protein
MSEKPINERVASIEKDNELCVQDRRDIWDAINGLRPLPERFDGFAASLDRIEDLCRDKEVRVAALERQDSFTKGQRNIVLGLAGFVAAGVGGIAMWLVTNIVWPAVKRAFNLG